LIVVGVELRSVAIESRSLQQFAHTPDVIADASRHCRGHTNGFVNAAEVVKSEPTRYSGPVVFPFFAEAIR
jgi:hypothetical protein